MSGSKELTAPDGQRATITASADLGPYLYEMAQHIPRTLIAQIRGCLNADMSNIAVLATLVLPDMCSAAEHADGEARGIRYKEWVDTHIAPKYVDAMGHRTLGGAELYALRCALAHQMRLTHPKLGYSTIWFDSSKHNVIEDGALHLSARTFCEDVLTAVESWLVASRGNPIIENNLASLTQLRVDLKTTQLTD